MNRDFFCALISSWMEIELQVNFKSVSKPVRIFWSLVNFVFNQNKIEIQLFYNYSFIISSEVRLCNQILIIAIQFSNKNASSLIINYKVQIINIELYKISMFIFKKRNADITIE